jgi:hypothetical protein
VKLGEHVCLEEVVKEKRGEEGEGEYICRVEWDVVAVKDW